jgi:thiol-disulfide isomerase/thioredoxin
MSKNTRGSRTKRLTTPGALLILIGLLLIAVVIHVTKPHTAPPTTGSLPEEQRANALAAGKPTFIFLHSLECVPCEEMMFTVAQVYPEFDNKVILVDVDVYADENASLLRYEMVRTIPTLVFSDRTGQRRVYIGVMEGPQLRQTLVALTGDL